MSIPVNHCDKCGNLTAIPEDAYGEFVCEDCEQNAAEAAWERQYEGEPPITLEERMAAARRLK